MTAQVSLSGFYAKLRNACDEAGGQSAWASAHGLSVSYVNDVLNARKDPGPKIASALGLQRVVAFVEVKERPDFRRARPVGGDDAAAGPAQRVPGSNSLNDRDLCGCEACVTERIDANPAPAFRGPTTPGWRYACETCGNKRCPHHGDHRMDCTGSNATGQVGSVA